MFVVPRVLIGKRVLIVEDEGLVALMIEDYMSDFGCTSVGPCSTVAGALNAVRSEVFDLAVLDINLNGEMSYPVADVLTGLGIPFLFVSGYGDIGIPADRPDWKVCPKPFLGNEFAAMLGEALTKPQFPLSTC